MAEVQVANASAIALALLGGPLRHQWRALLSSITDEVAEATWNDLIEGVRLAAESARDEADFQVDREVANMLAAERSAE